MEERTDRAEYEDALRLEMLYDILDKALITDPKIASAAKDARDVNYVTDEIYIKTRYGISMSLFKCWVKDRKLFDFKWQCDISKNADDLMSKR